MTVPEHLIRFPTGKAIKSLAQRFNLPDTQSMQDWEWEVADPDRIDEFLTAYGSGELSDDERFVLMEIILQSFEESEENLTASDKWQKVLRLIDENIELHIHSVWYWSEVEAETGEQFRVTPFLKEILEKYKDRFAP